MTLVYDTEELTVRGHVTTFGVRGRTGRHVPNPTTGAIVGTAIVGVSAIGAGTTTTGLVGTAIIGTTALAA